MDFALSSEQKLLREQIIKFPVVPLRPQTVAGLGFSQLRSNSQPVARPPYTSLNHILGTQFFTDFGDIHSLAPEGKR